jgi:hypothetical protein
MHASSFDIFIKMSNGTYYKLAVALQLLSGWKSLL